MLRYTTILLLALILVVSLTGSAKAENSVPLVINELMASNSSSIRDPQGQYDDWIEIHNYGTETIDAGGMYLTDNLSVPTKWQIPTNNPSATIIPEGGYLLIWADNDTADAGLHVNFKLDADGEQIGLFDNDGTTLIDSITFPAQITDISYGRDPNANDNMRFFGVPTPGQHNSEAYLGKVEAPEFNKERGFYDTSFYVTIATETEDADIYYTLDGSKPYQPAARGVFFFGEVYVGPIPINGTTCLRAVAVKPGWLSSDVVTNTYIFLDDVIRQPARPSGFPSSWGSRTADYAMDPDVVNDPAYSGEIKDDLLSTPSVSIVIPNEDFFGSEGIYANSTQYGDQWERAASIEWIDPNTSEHFGVNAGLRIHGGPYSRSGNIKNALRVIFRNEYGLSKLEYPLFPDTEVATFNTLALRSIWNYSWTGHSGMSGSRHADYLRDAFARDTVRDMGRLTPYGRPVQVYINGLYWGLYIMTERPDEHFVADHLGGNREDYDVLEAPSGYGGSTIMTVKSGGTGATQAWNELFSMADRDLSMSENYQAIQAHVDIPTMIDYMLMIYYVGSRDAPVFLGDQRTPRNFYAVRQREPASPFIFVPWDTEWALEYPTENRVNLVGVWNPHYLINRLRANPEFEMLIADHIHKQFFNAGALTRESTTQRYLARADEIYGAIVGESARWGDEPRPSQPYTRDVEWAGEVNRLVNEYFSTRTQIVINQFRQAGFYPSVDAPVFNINGAYQHGGMISDDDLLSMSAPSGTIFYTLDGSDPRSPDTAQQQATTLVPENADKRVIVPVEDIDDNWKDGGDFDDSAWLSCSGGPGGVGFERTSGYQDFFTLDLIDQMYARNATCYVRIPFTVDANYSTLMLEVRYDDGFVAYLNGVEVARRNFDGTPAWDSRASASHSDSAAVAFESINISNFIDNLRQGDNLLAVHGLNASTTSSDFLISVELLATETSSDDNGQEGIFEYTGPITLPHSAAVKARVLNGNTWSALNEAVYAIGPVAENLRITEIMYNPIEPNEEFIELVNIGAETINLNLVSFTNGIDFTFGDIELAADEYIVVVGNQNTFKARYGNNSTATGVNIAGQYSGRLNNAGERIELVDAIGRTILNFNYKDGWHSLTDGEDFSLTIIDPANNDLSSWDEKDSWRPSAYAGGSPGYDDSPQDGQAHGIVPDPGAIVINEVLAHSHAEASDWIELYNTTGTTIDIGGWFLSDSNDNLFKYEIAAGTTIGPYGYLVLYEDLNFSNANDPGAIEPFALSENGEKLYLSSTQNNVLTGYRNVEDFGASETGVSFGRYYKSGTGNYNFVAMEGNTPDSANSYPKVGPIVISEIMYNPDWPDGGSYTNDQYEYIELKNISNEPVKLYRDDKAEPWKFTDGIEFTFPANSPVTIPAGGVLLVVKHPTAFSWRYPNVPAGIIYGTYDGNLNNAGESLELSMPGDFDNEGTLHYIRIDRINYSDGSHPENCPGSIDLWPVETDGYGMSLTRKVPAYYGNDPDNWTAALVTPGK
ncbi:MAG: lamin tail domain-containing protein [Sedimentisphaerales bacterium]|nr:lamin tail domain-containing protein [Sedimentisphaerales bacterium]